MADNVLSLAEATRIAESIEQRWASYSKVVDRAGIASLFSDDIVFLGSHPQIYRGADGLRAYLASASDAGPDAIVFSDRHVQALSATILTTTSYVTFTATVAGSPTSSRWAISWTMAAEHGVWKIVQHHASPRPI